MANMTGDRYHLYERFGGTAASNSTSACRECGAIVYFSEAHDRWHDQQDALRELVANHLGLIEIGD